MSVKAKILVVDDEAAIRALAKQVLTELGHDVAEAGTGREALFAAREQKPDLILLDLMIPELNGIEVCRQVRADETTQDIRILVVSGADARAGLEESIIAGADDFLAKPISSLELSVRVRSLLRVRNIQDEEKRVEAYLKSLQALRPPKN